MLSTRQLGEISYLSRRGLGAASLPADPYSSIVGAIASAIGSVAQATPQVIAEIGTPETKKAADRQFQLSQEQIQAQTAQAALDNATLSTAVKYGAGAVGVGLTLLGAYALWKRSRRGAR